MPLGIERESAIQLECLARPAGQREALHPGDIAVGESRRANPFHVAQQDSGQGIIGEIAAGSGDELLAKSNRAHLGSLFGDTYDEAIHGFSTAEVYMASDQPEARFVGSDTGHIPADPHDVLDRSVGKMMSTQSFDRLDGEFRRVERVLAPDTPAMAGLSDENDLATHHRLTRPRQSAILIVSMRGEQGIETVESTGPQERELAPDYLFCRAARGDDLALNARLPHGSTGSDSSADIRRSNLVVATSMSRLLAAWLAPRYRFVAGAGQRIVFGKKRDAGPRAVAPTSKECCREAMWAALNLEALALEPVTPHPRNKIIPHCQLLPVT